MPEGFRIYNPEFDSDDPGSDNIIMQRPDGSTDEADNMASEAWLANEEYRQKEIERRMEAFKQKHLDDLLTFKSESELDEFFRAVDKFLQDRR